jgi:hypothetical protein
MKTICRIHKPDALWRIENESGLYDYINPDMDALLNHLEKKNDITYKDMEVMISNEAIEDYDAEIKYISTNKTTICHFEWESSEFYLLQNVCKFFNLFEEPNNLYFKVIPLPDLD